MKSTILAIAFLPLASAALAGGEAVLKLRTREAGMHRLSVRSIVDAGVDPASLDPRRLNLYRDGAPVPIAFDSGAGTSLAPDDGILFYGSWQDDPKFTRGMWDDQRAYFLHVGDDAPVRFAVPKRVSDAPAPPVEPGVFHRATWYEAHYISPYFNDDESEPFDHFMTHYFTAATARTTPSIAAPCLDATGGNARLEMYLYGRSSLPKNPDHVLSLAAGETTFPDIAFDGIKGHRHVEAIPVAAAANETFSLVMELKSALEDSADVVLLDWMRLDYPATLDSRGNAFETFAAVPEGTDRLATLTVTGLPSEGVRIFDIGNGTMHRAEVRRNAAGAFDASFEAHVTPNTRIVATPEGKFLAPTEVSAFRARDMATEAAGAELVIVAPPDFEVDARRLAEHRRSQGMPAYVALARDAYDNYGGGVKSPAAIRDFLKAAHAAPESKVRYVLLAGGASQDPKQLDYRTKNNPDYVPAMYYGSSRFAPFSWDNYYVAFGQDGETPDLAVGRIPARTPAEFAAVVDKIVAYESLESPDWMNRHVLLCSVEQALVDAVERTATVLGECNAEAQFERIFADPKLEDTIYAPKAVAAIDQGAGMVVFNGHGASHRWGQGPIGREPRRFLFDLQAVNELKNQNRYPIVLAATCYTNGFDDPAGGETIGRWWLMRPDGGGIAVVAPTYRVYLHEGNHLLNEFAQALLAADGTDRLGDAFLAAQRKMQHPEVRATMTLLGDPSLKIAALRSTVDPGCQEKKAAEKAAAEAAAAAATPTPTPVPAPPQPEDEKERVAADPEKD